MDSDSSLDGEFETKHEIAIHSRRNDVETADSCKSERDDGSDDGSDESAYMEGSAPPERDPSPVSSLPPLVNIETGRSSTDLENPCRLEMSVEKGALSPKLNNDLSGNESADRSMSSSSSSSAVSDGQPSSPIEPSSTSEPMCQEREVKEKNLPISPVDSVTVSNKLKKNGISGHGEDLSDVSDLDSNDGRDSLDVVSEEDGEKITKPSQDEWKGGVNTAQVEEMEQLDFEAEEQADKEEKEEGECEGGGDKSEDDGELKGDDLEEGELTDEDENRPEETEPRPVCRFYNRGQCTWGSSCRFVHPGVTDKGNYTMFDMVRPLVPVNGPPVFSPMDYRAPYEKPAAVSSSFQSARKEETPVFESAWERGLRQAKEMMRKSTKRKETDMDFEEKKMNLSLGQEELDKENDYYTRPASPILKDEPDRWGGLKLLEAEGKYPEDSLLADRYDDYPESPPAYYHQPSRGGADYWRRVHYEPGESRAMRIETDYGGSSRKYQSHQHRAPPTEYYEKKKKPSHAVREVIMQRSEKHWRDERYAEASVPSHRGRGDEWADPWMRSKSPSGRKTGSRPTRRQSYSSGSSYSSSSSSRSSSQSSYSSYSHDSRSRSRSKSLSRSRSRSSSHTPISRSRRKTNRPLVPTSRAAEGLSPTFQPASPRKLSKTQGNFTKANLIQSEKKAATERALLMNPPAPSPRKQKEVRPPSPGMMRKSAQNPPPPSNSKTKINLDRSKAAAAAAAAALSAKVKLRSHSKSSQSSSGSDSSGSSSDTSESSYSSSSSSREPSPKAVRPPKRIVIDERERESLAQSWKVKAMDALKLSGQKQQIKLTLKAPGTAAPPPTSKRPVTGLPELPELNLIRRERTAPLVVTGKKRPAEEPPGSLESSLAMSKPALKKATSRREELLKQLKAVEDAIARKRSKV